MYPGCLLPLRPLSSSWRPAIDLPSMRPYWSLVLFPNSSHSPSKPELTSLFSLPPVGPTQQRAGSAIALPPASSPLSPTLQPQ